MLLRRFRTLLPPQKMKFWRWVRERGGTKKGRKLRSFYHGDELVETSMQLWRDYYARLYESNTALEKKKKKKKRFCRQS